MTDKEDDQKTEDTSWVEVVSKQKEAEKQIMLEMSNVEEDKEKKSTRCRKLLYVLIVALVVAVVVLGVKLSSASTNQGPALENADSSSSKSQEVKTKGAKKDICMTKECILAAAQVIQSMDSTVDPCDSFYEYACGGWRKTHTVPSDRGNLHTYGVLRDDVLLQLKNILEEPIEDGELEVFKNVKRLYRSCMDEEMIENRTSSVIFPLLDEFGGWPLLGDSAGGQWNESDFELESLLLRILKYNNRPLVYVWAGVDDLNNTKYTLFIDQPGTGMPGRDYYLTPSYEPKLQAYRTMIRNAAVMLGASETTIDDDVNDLIKLETDIANITVPRENRRDSASLYNAMTIRDLQENFSQGFKFAGQPPCHEYKFDWLKYLQGALYLPDEHVNITEDEEVVLVSIPYYRQLWIVLSGYSKRTVTNYIITRIILNRLKNLPERFRNEYQKYRKSLYGIQAAKDRWKTCAAYVKGVSRDVVGRLFVERHFNEQARAETNDMIKNIRSAFFEQITGLDWMYDGMKKVARLKAEEIVSAVGYSEEIMNDTVLETDHNLGNMDSDNYLVNVLNILQDRVKNSFASLRKTKDVTKRLSWTTSPTTVNAFYSPQRNQITFPAGILQPPYFQNGRPRAMNYGGVGFLVGHEITHGFDDRGRMYDEIGNLNNWWTEEAEVAFKEKAQCIVDQYSNYYWSTAELNINGIATQGENIADNGGIKQAYKGYKKWQQSHPQPDLILPWIDFNHDQLFFIGFAQSRCGVTRKSSAVNQILTGVHGPNTYRVDGSLANMPEFARVFSCPLNSTMNPGNRCAVW